MLVPGRSNTMESHQIHPFSCAKIDPNSSKVTTAWCIVSILGRIRNQCSARWRYYRLWSRNHLTQGTQIRRFSNCRSREGEQSRPYQQRSPKFPDVMIGSFTLAIFWLRGPICSMHSGCQLLVAVFQNLVMFVCYNVESPFCTFQSHKNKTQFTIPWKQKYEL